MHVDREIDLSSHSGSSNLHTYSNVNLPYLPKAFVWNKDIKFKKEARIDHCNQSITLAFVTYIPIHSWIILSIKIMYSEGCTYYTS